jgi:hypothetical protein
MQDLLLLALQNIWFVVTSAPGQEQSRLEENLSLEAQLNIDAYSEAREYRYLHSDWRPKVP